VMAVHRATVRPPRADSKYAGYQRLKHQPEVHWPAYPAEQVSPEAVQYVVHAPPKISRDVKSISRMRSGATRSKKFTGGLHRVHGPLGKEKHLESGVRGAFQRNTRRSAGTTAVTGDTPIFQDLSRWRAHPLVRVADGPLRALGNATFAPRAFFAKLTPRSPTSGWRVFRPEHRDNPLSGREWNAGRFEERYLAEGCSA
jgi:hypothetical protein